MCVENKKHCMKSGEILEANVWSNSHQHLPIHDSRFPQGELLPAEESPCQRCLHCAGLDEIRSVHLVRLHTQGWCMFCSLCPQLKYCLPLLVYQTQGSHVWGIRRW